MSLNGLPEKPFVIKLEVTQKLPQLQNVDLILVTITFH